MIHIGRAGAKLGSFSEFEVRMGLKSGRFLLTDLGWKEGMENWTPLSQFAEFQPEPPALPEPPELDPEPPPLLETAEPAGLPWEHRAEIGFFPAFIQTARWVLFDPTAAFSQMFTQGSLLGPGLYNLLGGWFGLVISCLYAVIVTRAVPDVPPPSTSVSNLFYISPAKAVTELQFVILMGPVLVTTFALVASLIIHLCLMLVGGANKSFHVTFRVICFSYGSAQLLQIIPVLGGVALPVWLILCCIFGLAAAHRTSPGRSVGAVALFLLTCVTCCMGTFFLAYLTGVKGG
jgi:hypothetical protein